MTGASPENADHGCLPLELAGECVLLHPRRALIWPAERMLMVADTHFGKGAELRRGGIALPRGSSKQDLDCLAALIAAHGIRRLAVLGDLVHGRIDPREPFVRMFDAWRARHEALRIDVVRGNHDHPAARKLLPEIHWHEEPLAAGPFVLQHRPQADTRGYVLAGHVHPAVRLAGPGGDRARFPAFKVGEDTAVLPAFGSLTGGHRMTREPGARLYATLGGRVAAVTPG